MTNRIKDKPLRYSALWRLDSGKEVDTEFDYLHEAISYSKRMSAEGCGWWEVINNRTRNLMAGSDAKR